MSKRMTQTLTTHRIDLLVDGGVKVDSPQELVGQMVTVDELYPYIECASGVRIVQEVEAVREELAFLRLHAYGKEGDSWQDFASDRS